MRLKEADKVRNQILALLDSSAVSGYVDIVIYANGGDDFSNVKAHAVREYADYIRRQISQGATDSTFATC